jgi:hypothetical protein
MHRQPLIPYSNSHTQNLSNHSRLHAILVFYSWSKSFLISYSKSNQPSLTIVNFFSLYTLRSNDALIQTQTLTHGEVGKNRLWRYESPPTKVIAIRPHTFSSLISRSAVLQLLTLWNRNMKRRASISCVNLTKNFGIINEL